MSKSFRKLGKMLLTGDAYANKIKSALMFNFSDVEICVGGVTYL